MTQLIMYTHPKVVENWEPYREHRGHIKDEHGNWVARPFDKFFNYYQPEADQIDLDEFVLTFDKVDGSLGIGWIHPDTGVFTISTKGGFTSAQANYANEVLLPRYMELGFEPVGGLTYMFEIVYPDNRIVVDYGDWEGLVLLAVRENDTGDYLYGKVGGWHWDFAQVRPETTLRAVLEAEPRPNAEGVVVTTADGRRVKVKQDDYFAKHWYATRMTKRKVWEALVQGVDPREDVPDEFYGLISTWADELQEAYNALYSEVVDAYRELPPTTDRKEFARLVQGLTHRGLLFRLYDNEPIETKIWEIIRP